jgi:hypothetical protein
MRLRAACAARACSSWLPWHELGGQRVGAMYVSCESPLGHIGVQSLGTPPEAQAPVGPLT